MKAFLINAYDLKKKSFIQGNVEDSILVPLIRVVQDTMIEPIIGTLLFNRLLEGIEADNLNSDESDLMENYVIPCIAMGCNIEAVMQTTFQIRNKTTGVNNDETIKGASLSEVARVEDNYRSKFEFYRLKLIKHLKFNSNLFPEYMQYFDGNSLFPCLDEFGFVSEGIKPDSGTSSVNVRFA